jgi:DNA-binding IclR family transcriptional regulator
MVFVLQQRGYLAREAGTDRLGAVAAAVRPRHQDARAASQLTSVVLPLMERFSEESGQAAHLVVLSRAQTVVLATTSGHLDASVTVRPGYGRPALDANSGLLILAFQSEARRAGS